MNIEDLTLYFGSQLIFDNISIKLNLNTKVGVVGLNGAGKTTLFNVIINKIEPMMGKVKINSNSRIAYLPQVIELEKENINISVFDYLLSARPIEDLEEKLQELYTDISNEKNQKRIDFIMKKISIIEQKLEYFDVYNYENILLKLISGMNIDSNLLDMKLCDLSGGQKSKIAFARLLYSKPEIILLDEPTNHLDKESRDYVIDYLKNYKGMVLIISHDISFLNQIINYTLYLDKLTHKAELFCGNYEKYQKIITERKLSEEKLLKKQNIEEEKLKKIISKYIRGNEKKANIAKDRQKKLAKLEQNKVKIEKELKDVNYKINLENLGGKVPIKVDNLSFGYNKDNEIIKDLSFELKRGEKLLIVGVNGVGKSTLLKLIYNKLISNRGTISFSCKTQMAYYAQEHELLDSEKTVIENFDDLGLTVQKIRTVLGSFLFFGDDIYKKIKVLSPGERSRVALARISISGANLILLDEPTNHLDYQTQSVIADVFKNYPGTLLLVSHNTQFVDSLNVDKMLVLPEGKMQFYDKKILEHYQKINEQNK